MKEVDLYPPVKLLFESLGYEVKSEVAHMDVVAHNGIQMVVIELKTSFNLKLLLQATLRQRLCEQVYVAIPAPTGRQRFSKGFKDYEYLLKRLELGLILVSFKDSVPCAKILFDPAVYDRHASMQRNKKKKAMALRELSERHGDYNVGGSNGKIMTVYREKALIALSYAAELEGEFKVKTLRELTGNDKIQPMLKFNHYGWFENPRRGYYQVSTDGLAALESYKAVIENLRTLI